MTIKYLKYVNSVDFENRYWEIFNNLLKQNPNIEPDVLANNALLLTEVGFEKLEKRELLLEDLKDGNAISHYKTIK